MTFAQAEQYIFSLASIAQSVQDHTQNIKRIQYFLDLLGNPEKNIPEYIHVTGTSGKGSVCAFLQSILTMAGKKTGLLCSPHPTTILERWKIGHKYMSKSEFVSIVRFLKPILDVYARTSPFGMISFFDVTTIIGLVFFAKHKVNFAVMEVGCGGRFDSTNVIPNKRIAVITNIGLDHMELLGDTKEKIAFEKSGIIKKGSEVFTMEMKKNILQIIEAACKTKNIKLNRVGMPQNISINQQKQSTSFQYQNQWYTLNLRGDHQIHNAILCIEISKTLKISEKNIQKGLLKASQPLRFEIVSQQPIIILDGAHNEDKINTTVETVQSLGAKNIHLVVGFSEDKKKEEMIKTLSKLQPKTIACTRNTMNPFKKVASPMEIRKLCKKYCPNSKIEIFLDPKDAFTWSKKQQKSQDLLLVTGSIFLSGEIKANIFSN